MVGARLLVGNQSESMERRLKAFRNASEAIRVGGSDRVRKLKGAVASHTESLGMPSGGGLFSKRSGGDPKHIGKAARGGRDRSGWHRTATQSSETVRDAIGQPPRVRKPWVPEALWVTEVHP